MTNTAFDQIFRDSNGEIVVAQPPNLPLIVTIAASLLKLATGEINTALDLLTLLGVNAQGFLVLRPDLTQEHCCT